MTDRSPSLTTYVVIDLVLIVLTVITVALSFIEEPAIGHLLGGLVIGVIKAALVILFFMHALRSRAQTKAVILVTIFWFAVVMLVLTFSDYATRDIIPNMQGH